ncbi:YitT family protein [Muricauda sp. 2012CJ35-5]|uniref:YitT family protein n=1 Tax=Flagellimonas spongiicola TaxID=2942208 RepID=A0ABT0PU19_9FLAO|nr:YitT family protein [Allomuricauda spongiicola]MCL6273958.1 YitT family protein [Allomuricauda spongiicola]
MTTKKTKSGRILKDSFFITIGIFAAAFGLESFLLPNIFIDGGVTGISLLISEITQVPLWLLIVIINLPFIFMAYKVIGRQFALKTAIAILGLALTLLFVEFPEVTQDRLLVAVFGGFFLGAGIGLSIRGGGVLDGTEVLAIFLSKKWGLKIGDIIILINGVIFLAAAYLLSIESALYSMLTYLAASKTLDFVVEGIEEYTGVTIISKQSEEIRKMIVEKMGRGLTIYEAKGGYGNHGEQNEYNVIYTVITRLEIRKLHIEIDKIDSTAFVVMSSINDTRGGMVKKRFLGS